MAKPPMKVIPDDLFPPEVDTPKKQFEFVGKRLFSIHPDEVIKPEEPPEEPPQPGIHDSN